MNSRTVEQEMHDVKDRKSQLMERKAEANLVLASQDSSGLELNKEATRNRPVYKSYLQTFNKKLPLNNNTSKQSYRNNSPRIASITHSSGFKRRNFSVQPYDSLHFDL